METFALAHPVSPKRVSAWCQPLDGGRFEVLNGGWTGVHHPERGTISIEGTDDDREMPAIEVWRGEVPAERQRGRAGYNEAIAWIEEQL